MEVKVWTKSITFIVEFKSYQWKYSEWCFFLNWFQKKIDKRGRKLVDYDSQRHNYQSLQGNPKKRDEIKVTKARESLEEAKRTYELLNSELHDELPALYDSRVLFLVTNLQTLFAAEQVFHAETAKVNSLFLNKLFHFHISCTLTFF